jgi:hypothetical protein
VWCLQVWAALAAFEGRLTEAAQLIGFVDAERVRTGQPLQSAEQLLHADLLRRLEEGLRASDRLARMAEGAAWSEAEAGEFTTTRLLPVRLPNSRSARGRGLLAGSP